MQIAKLSQQTEEPKASTLSEVDETALRYYAQTRDLKRLGAELRRLKTLYPDWDAPEDLFDAPTNISEQPLWDIFGSGDQATIALIGTSYSDKPISNFAGYIEHWTGVPLDNYSISGGNQFGSILSYITSREFQEQRPRFLIWENPIYNNLGQYGDAPWAEIVASGVPSSWAAAAAKAPSAERRCSRASTVSVTFSASSMRAASRAACQA